MGLQKNNPWAAQEQANIERNFGIAQDGKPSEEELALQASLRETFTGLAVRINRDITPGPAKTRAIIKLQEGLMWAGKAIFS